MGSKLFENIELKYSIYSPFNQRKSQFPRISEPLIVFAGRSNVGKSSIINCLANKKVAYVSKTPGKTRGINYYFVNSKFFLVDLPGYGFAKVEKKKVEEWNYLINKFFQENNNILLTALVIDIRRELQDLDKMMLEFLGGINLQSCIILNKADKLTHGEIDLKKSEYQKLLGLTDEFVIPFSVKTELGKREFVKLIDYTLKYKEIA